MHFVAEKTQCYLVLLFRLQIRLEPDRNGQTTGPKCGGAQEETSDDCRSMNPLTVIRNGGAG